MYRVETELVSGHDCGCVRYLLVIWTGIWCTGEGGLAIDVLWYSQSVNDFQERNVSSVFMDRSCDPVGFR